MVRFGMLLAGAIFLIWLPFVSAEAQRLVEFGDPAVTGQQAAGPIVLRGSAIAPKPAPKREEGAWRIGLNAGENLWLIDRERARLTFCERRFGTNVGARLIACTSRDLPARLAR